MNLPRRISDTNVPQETHGGCTGEHITGYSMLIYQASRVKVAIPHSGMDPGWHKNLLSTGTPRFKIWPFIPGCMDPGLWR
ncbi:uncharacterized protein LAJ45_02490 [Morchella importuna]|uniref:uncharacterized protein n=1 Tax=Morchella importuna TaxID=1174673 RepID=UPI001E8D1684|nr:uncharacterized protein LAJ45_02490 [Morchella importuna]KAH8153677.1 hypothetical protein LAJ45_02490 [Morchella importuna]